MISRMLSCHMVLVSRSGLSRFNLAGLLGRSDGNFLTVLTVLTVAGESSSELALNALTQVFGTDNMGGCPKVQDPRHQFEFAADMKLHSNSSVIDFAALLRRMPDARSHVLRDIGAEDDFNIERIFLD